MSKLAPASIKYMIKAKIKAKGVVEKPDVIGAVFGQTEGLLGSDLNLRDLQKTGRIGRIDVEIKSQKGNSVGEIIIPSALDSAETALIAATLETIERIGPCEAEVKLEGVEDTRADKRKFVMDRSKKILAGLMEKGTIETDEISETLREDVRKEEVTTYYGLPAGPAIKESEDIVVVEGRADVINLLKYGIKNAIAVEGTSVSKELVQLAKERTITVFVDGDRGGQLIVKEIMQLMDIDFVAQAPEGKEVEELTQKETHKALREKIPAKQFGDRARERPPAGRPPERPQRTDQDRPPQRMQGGFRPRERRDSRGFRGRGGFRDRERGGFRDRGGRFSRDRRPAPMPIPNPDEKALFDKTLKELAGSESACIFDADSNMLGKVPVSDLANTIKTIDSPYAVVLDGKIDSSLNYVARSCGVKFLIGTDK